MGDTVAEADVLGSMGVGLEARGDLVRAQTHYEQALATFRRLNLPEREEWILGQLGLTTIGLGDYATAEEYLIHALAISIQLEDTFWQAWVRLRLGTVWYEQGDAEKALPFITEAFQTAGKIQSPRFQAAVLYHWGNTLLIKADWASAEQKYKQAYDLWEKVEQTANAMQAVAGLAYVAYQQAMPDIAAAHAERLWQTWQASPAMAESANLRLYWMLGLVWEGLDDSRADQLWESACDLLHKRSAQISDEGRRRMFMEQVPAHQGILNTSL